MPPVSGEDTELVQDGKLNRADCLCPICLEIFLEPVTLPCAHTFCKPCFLETVDKANICCPLCRKRVSTWARLNGRNKTLVNAELWRRIQDTFPTQCQRRLNGVDEEEDVNMFIPKPKVSLPGELRQEYEEEVNKFVEEKRALEEAERRASEEYIQRLLAEEEDRVEEERRRQEERQLEDDEKLARLLSEELNSNPVLETRKHIKVNDAKKKKSDMGHIERYLCQVPYTPPHCETTQSSTLLDNKENILSPPTSVDPSSIELHCLDSSSKPSTSSSDSDTCKQLFDTSYRTTVYSKRKSADGEQLEPGICKKPCNFPPSPVGSVLLHAEQEEDLRIRMLQEEEDRRLALRLQRELNREIAVDRRKGSANGYLLREKSSPSSSNSTSPGEENKMEKACIPHSSSQVDGHKAKRVSSQVEWKTSRKCSVSTQVSPSTASSVQKSRKQATLTEMFPSLGS
ncbi:E3 ubiquitin-protein ligase rnf168 isoform X1 [Tachysurus fulvidraco]|uniref:E3 ubiquitin-protein ligase rnf168 isoform X1 n=1 Tax=Tachysurus fulvidraco TaxID=1234273 RepID=UPI001FEE435A|nr:E3 ubiquitin-protein ligase rnf168 isoform X1 [Tachysurus fulvidraco]XP_047676862.1 E3 ubiquitin-protein ligase rnf168 isoform X1 [Tachysurus fulvidraco]